MIKKLLFAASLLVPSLAYGANPTADLQVQIVPSSGVACDTGTHAPAIPAAAQAAGFTTCALYLNFADATGATANTANFMYNCGTTIPHPLRMYFLDDLNSGAFNGDANCNRTTIVTSPRGFRSLFFNNTPADHNNPPGHSLSVLGWTGTDINGKTLPLWGYVEMVFEFVGREQPGGEGNPSIAAFWRQNSGQFPNEAEYDDMEIFKNGYTVTSGDGHSYTVNCGVDAGVCADNMDWTQPHRYGVLTTTDGAGIAAQCVYIDGVLKTCFTSSPGEQYNDNHLVWWLGNCSGGLCIVEDVNIFLHKVQVWECANWATSSCQTALVTNPPSTTN
jgi:hypothetical protein